MAATCFLLLSCLGLAITAQAQSCSRPAAGPNMSLKDSDILTPTFQDGSKVTFVCDVGYTSAGGSGVTTCTAGTWSRVTLKCDRKNCGPAGEVTNGYVDYPESTYFGDKCVVMCYSGYILVGQNELLCGDQGWMGRLPVCEVVSCDPPAAIQDGTFSTKKDTYDYREAVEYTCNNNYILDGSKYLTCSEDGTFTPAPPKCTMVQCENPNILNAEWTGGSRPPYGYQALVIYRCKTGYSMTGASTQTCDIRGQWSPGLPSCQLMLTTPKATTTTTTTTTTRQSHSTKKPTVTVGPTSDPTDKGNTYALPLGITFGVICAIVAICGVVVCCKKKQGFRRGYPEKVETIQMERQ